MEWAEEKEVMAGMLEELASTMRAVDSAQECLPAMVRVFVAAMGMLGEGAESIFNLAMLPLGGLEGVKGLADLAERGELE